MLSILLQNVELLGIELIDLEDFIELLIRFTFNLTIAVVIIRYIYYPVTKRKDYLFTNLLISTIVFLLCYLLESVKLQLGFALGLFAIFGIIRYRTNPVPIKEMTYLFVVIGLSVINALSNKKVSYAELLFTNLIIVSISFGLEKIWLLKHESVKTIIYEKIDLILPEKREELINDLQARTGININRIEVGRVDFLRDIARIKIYYFNNDNDINYADDEGGLT